MTDIIVFAGPKQSGKSSAAYFIMGYVMTQMARRNAGLPLPTKFDITEKGELVVNSEFLSTDGETIVAPGILDVNRRDYQFVNYAQEFIWPYVKNYAFADTLKDIAIHLYGLTYEQCYGSDEDKNTLTNIKWANFTPLFSHKDKMEVTSQGKTGKRMTAREFLQTFGTQVCRQIYDDCWVESCFKRIEAEAPSIAIITDARFENEIDYCLSKGARVIRLTERPNEDNHISETEIDKVPLTKFSKVIDNANMTITEKNQEILDYLYSEGVLKGHV
jgi:hypothetical protein